MADAGSAEEWDVVVPDDDAELLAELRRHGVKPGQRLHVRSTSRQYRSTLAEGGVSRSKTTGTVRSVKTGRYVSGAANAGGRSGQDPRTQSESEPEFIGSFDSSQPDLAERAEELLRAHFPDR